MLAALRGALRTEPNVAFALLFGSAARGDDGGDSDLDLIVALRDPSMEGMVELQDRLERRLGREVDVLSVEAASSNDLLISMAVEEGRVLVDRIDLWPDLRSELGALRRRADRTSKRERQRSLAAIDERGLPSRERRRGQETSSRRPAPVEEGSRRRTGEPAARDEALEFGMAASLEDGLDLPSLELEKGA